MPISKYHAYVATYWAVRVSHILLSAHIEAQGISYYFPEQHLGPLSP